MREKLIQLIKQAHMDYWLSDDCTDGIYEFIADRLIEDGVILPPVKEGQTVWLIRHNPYEGYVIKENKAVNIGMCFSKNSEVCVTVVTTKEDILGKTVFLTYEAAEAALKAREKQ